MEGLQVDLGYPFTSHQRYSFFLSHFHPNWWLWYPPIMFYLTNNKQKLPFFFEKGQNLMIAVRISIVIFHNGSGKAW
jgi:hypothetical protein